MLQKIQTESLQTSMISNIKYLSHDEATKFIIINKICSVFGKDIAARARPFFFGDPSSLNFLQKDRSVDLRKEKWREDGGNLERALAPPVNLGPHEFFQRRHPGLTESAMKTSANFGQFQ